MTPLVWLFASALCHDLGYSLASSASLFCAVVAFLYGLGVAIIAVRKS